LALKFVSVTAARELKSAEHAAQVFASRRHHAILLAGGHHHAVVERQDYEELSAKEDLILALIQPHELACSGPLMPRVSAGPCPDQ
jgi:hypothetical protein